MLTRLTHSIFVFAYAIILSDVAFATTETTLEVDSLRSGIGHLAVSVFKAEEKSAFPGDSSKAVLTFYIPLEGKTSVNIPISNLENGDYAISVMHDENSDHKMSFNFIGIPKEGFGFSQNPKVFFGPPSFEKAKVHLGEGTEPIHIRMKYFL